MAAAAGDLLKVRQALRSWGVDVNARNGDGCTPLHIARTADVAKKLIATETVRLAAEDKDGRGPLHYAVLKRRPTVVKALLEAGVDQFMEDDDGKTTAYYAQECNASRWMLKYGPGVETVGGDHLDNTGLFHMAWLGDAEATRFFIEQGADVDARNKDYETALTEASRDASMDVVKILLQNDVKVDIAESGRGWEPLCNAVRDTRLEVVSLLLEHGANKHAKLKSGCDAMAEACYRGHHEIARILIEQGSRLESVNHFGRTRLLEASTEADGDWTRWLLRRGAKTDVRDNEGRSPVRHAANGGHNKTMPALLE